MSAAMEGVQRRSGACLSKVLSQNKEDDSFKVQGTLVCPDRIISLRSVRPEWVVACLFVSHCAAGLPTNGSPVTTHTQNVSKFSKNEALLRRDFTFIHRQTLTVKFIEGHRSKNPWSSSNCGGPLVMAMWPAESKHANFSEPASLKSRSRLEPLGSGVSNAEGRRTQRRSSSRVLVK